MANEELDLESMDINELAKLAIEEAENAGQPRDAQGRFISAQESEPTVNETEEVQTEEEAEELVYRREIDLGDGAGVQVFEGRSLEELVDKFAKAQEHATRKIRAQEAQLKQSQAPPVTPDPNADYELSQRLLQNPSKALRDWFQNETGMTVEQFKQTQSETRELTTTQKNFNTAREWADANPEFYGSQKNATKIEKWLKTEGLACTPENLDKAFADLNESGLLESKPVSTDASSTEVTRIARPMGQVRRAASGVSSRRSAPVVTPTLTEDDLYSMPEEQLARLSVGVKL